MIKTFRNRIDAARQLSSRMHQLGISEGIVLAIPRGGVPIGAEIARALHLPLDIFLSKKIGHPGNPEYAIGSVTLDSFILDQPAEAVDPAWIRAEVGRIQDSLRARYEKFLGDRQPLAVEGATVILTDDGVATGNTLFAAIADLRKKRPARIIVAVPVAPPHTADRIRKEADLLICLVEERNFYAIGQFYDDFRPVEDEEVQQLLHTYGPIGQ